MDERFSIRHFRERIKYVHRILKDVNILHAFNPTLFWDFVSDLEASELFFVQVTQVARLFWTVATHTQILPSSSLDFQYKMSALHAPCNSWAKQSGQNIVCYVRWIATFVTFPSNTSWHVFKFYSPLLVYAMTLSLMIKSSINFKTVILILMPSVPIFEYGIPRRTCLYFHAHTLCAWRGEIPLSSESSMNQKTKKCHWI